MNATQFQIRPGTVSDAALLASFAARTFAETFGPDSKPEDMRAHLESSYGVSQQGRELADPTVSTLMTFDGETLVAFAQLRRSTPPPCVTEPSSLEVYRFYVDKPAHGRGVAQRLMAAVKGGAREWEGQHLWLSVWERNARAIAFYTKAGFVDVGQTDFFLGPDRQVDRVLVASTMDREDAADRTGVRPT